MSEIYRTQFSLPFAFIEKLNMAAVEAGRSVDAELAARLEQSFSTDINQADMRTVFEILERLSKRNPKLRYQFAITAGEEEELRLTEIESGTWRLPAISSNLDDQGGQQDEGKRH